MTLPAFLRIVIEKLFNGLIHIVMRINALKDTSDLKCVPLSV